MSNINQVLISGNLTQEPRLSKFPNFDVLNFSIASNGIPRDGVEPNPVFVDVAVYGKRAEPLSRILQKGKKVTVNGRLKLDRWTTSGGNRRSKLTVVANNVDIMQQAPTTASAMPV